MTRQNNPQTHNVLQYPTEVIDTGLSPAFRVNRFTGPILIAITTLVMLIWSWGTWPDPLVDFGAQLYVPWQISTGHVLYRDLAYYNGPLSSYFNAAMFRLFGVGLSTLVWTNLIVLAVAMILAYRLTTKTSGRLAATIGGLVFSLIFAFGQVVRLGNYNWITPYTHEITHGVVLGLATIAAIARYQQTNRRRWIAIAGGLLGLVFLTKAEPMAATAAAVIVQFLGGWWFNHDKHRRVIGPVILLLATSSIAPLIAWILLLLSMPPMQALRGVLGSWPWVFDHRVTSLHFYRDVAGLDDVGVNLWIVLRWSAVYVILIGLGTAAGLLCRTLRARLGIIIAAFVVCSATILFCWPGNWSGMLTPLPICLIILFTITLVALLRRTNSSAPLQLTLIVFASVLAAKMGLKAYAYHYGFVLVWPGTVVLICAITRHLPDWIDHRGGCGSVLRAAALPALMAATWAMLSQDARHFAARQSIVAGGTADEFRSDQRGAEVQRVCSQIAQRVPVNGTVMVLPQGLMVNYLTRRASPTRYINFMPPEVLAAGEQTILQSLQQHPPDAIVLTPAVIENGCFTLDDRDPYGAATLKWVMASYAPLNASEMKKPLIIMLRKRD